jgi:hypothetical protein
MAFEKGSKCRASMSALVDRRIEMSIEGDESRVDDLQDEFASTAQVGSLRFATRLVGKSLGDWRRAH